MARQKWLLVLCIVWLAGCGRQRKDVVSDEVLSDLTATVHNDRPGRIDQAAGSPSPYDLRSLPLVKDQASQSTIVRVGNNNPPTVPTEPVLEKAADSLPPPPVSQEPEKTPPPPLNTTLRKQEKPEDPLVTLVRFLREGQTGEATAQLKLFEPATRDVLGVLLPVLTHLAEPGRAGDPPHDCATILEQLETLSQELRPKAALSIEKMCYCRCIERFGIIDPLPSSHLYHVGPQGRPGDLVQVYVELRNFASLKRGSSYETRLACNMLIRDEQNRIVWYQDRQTRLERSCTPRQDGYLDCYFNVPRRLPVGDYTLWIMVKDLTGNSGEEAPPHRIAKRSLDFRVRTPEIEIGAMPVAGS
jgi:hypothetical protein